MLNLMMVTEKNTDIKFGIVVRKGAVKSEYCKVLNFGTPEIINFPFGTNGKLIFLGVPMHLTHSTVVRSACGSSDSKSSF